MSPASAPPPPSNKRVRYQRRVSEQDRWLDDKGLYRKHVVADASCLFRIVSEHVYTTQGRHIAIRKDCVRYMIEHEEGLKQLVSGSYKDYVTELRKADIYGGLVDIKIMSIMYKYDFIIYDNSKGPETYITNGFDRIITLYHIKEKKHFDVLYPKQYMNDVSFCQSLLYGILYKNVYKMIDVDYAVKKMLYGKDNNSIDYYMPESVLRRTSNQLSKLESPPNTKNLGGAGDVCLTKGKDQTEDSEVINFTVFLMDSGDSIMITLDTSNAREMLDNKVLPFPYKVAKALDPIIYRNVELDSWYEIKKDEQPSGQYFDGLSLQVGVKCLCSLNPNSSATYHCHIQDMKGEDGPCVVFVEELGEMRTVSMNQLKPLPADEAKPWYTPYKKERTRFYSIAGILRQLGYVGITNNYKFKYKLKKAGGIGQELAQLKENIDWMNGKNGKSERFFHRLDLIDSNMDDKNNNIPNDADWERDYYGPNDDGKIENQFYECLESYTEVEMSNFTPYKVEYVAMPLVVEQGANTPTVSDNVREASSANSRPNSAPYQGSPDQSQGNLQTSASSELIPSPSYPASAAMSGTSVNFNSMMAPSGGVVWASSGGLYNTYPMYCAPPRGAMAPPPPMMPSLRYSGPPPGVNMAVQRSLDISGADLPYNDTQTLRYYFNLGVECFQSCRGWHQPQTMPTMPLHTIMPPMGPPPSTPTPSYTHSSNRVSPNQLCAEFQQSLTLEDSNNNNTTQDKDNSGGVKSNNNGGNMQKGKGGMEYGNSRRGCVGGGFSGRYRGGSGGGNHRSNNYNRNQSYYRGNNNNHHNHNNKGSHHNNKVNSDADVANNANSRNQDKDVTPQSQDNQQVQQENSFPNPVPFIPYPPPPLFRVSYPYTVDADNSMMSMGYPSQYIPYNPIPDDTVSSTSEGAFVNPGPPPYVGYLSTAPSVYYPPVAPNYNYSPSHFLPMTPDNNQSK